MAQVVRIFGEYGVAMAVVGGVAGVVAWRVTGRVPPAVTAALVGSVLAGVLAVTVEPLMAGEPATGINLVPFRTIIQLAPTSLARRNIAGNVVLFVPVGFAFGLVFRRRRHGFVAAVAAALALSLGIEALQWLLPVGRVVDVDDVILNVAGAAVGALLAAVALRGLRAVRRS